jgi:hypothetical protein
MKLFLRHGRCGRQTRQHTTSAALLPLRRPRLQRGSEMGYGGSVSRMRLPRQAAVISCDIPLLSITSCIPCLSGDGRMHLLLTLLNVVVAMHVLTVVTPRSYRGSRTWHRRRNSCSCSGGGRRCRSSSRTATRAVGLLPQREDLLPKAAATSRLRCRRGTCCVGRTHMLVPTTAGALNSGTARRRGIARRLGRHWHHHWREWED